MSSSSPSSHTLSSQPSAICHSIFHHLPSSAIFGGLNRLSKHFHRICQLPALYRPLTIRVTSRALRSLLSRDSSSSLFHSCRHVQICLLPIDFQLSPRVRPVKLADLFPSADTVEIFVYVEPADLLRGKKAVARFRELSAELAKMKNLQHLAYHSDEKGQEAINFNGLAEILGSSGASFPPLYSLTLGSSSVNRLLPPAIKRFGLSRIQEIKSLSLLEPDSFFDVSSFSKFHLESFHVTFDHSELQNWHLSIVEKLFIGLRSLTLEFRGPGSDEQFFAGEVPKCPNLTSLSFIFHGQCIDMDHLESFVINSRRLRELRLDRSTFSAISNISLLSTIITRLPDLQRITFPQALFHRIPQFHRFYLQHFDEKGYFRSPAAESRQQFLLNFADYFMFAVEYYDTRGGSEYEEGGDGMRCVARMYEDGLAGFERNLERGCDLMHEAADVGDSIAQARYGLKLINGDGMKADLSNGLRWLRASAQESNEPAIARIAASEWRNEMPPDVKAKPVQPSQQSAWKRAMAHFRRTVDICMQEEDHPPPSEEEIQQFMQLYDADKISEAAAREFEVVEAPSQNGGGSIASFMPDRSAVESILRSFVSIASDSVVSGLEPWVNCTPASTDRSPLSLYLTLIFSAHTISGGPLHPGPSQFDKLRLWSGLLLQGELLRDWSLLSPRARHWIGHKLIDAIINSSDWIMKTCSSLISLIFFLDRFADFPLETRFQSILSPGPSNRQRFICGMDALNHTAYLTDDDIPFRDLLFPSCLQHFRHSDPQIRHQALMAATAFVQSTSADIPVEIIKQMYPLVYSHIETEKSPEVQVELIWLLRCVCNSDSSIIQSEQWRNILTFALQCIEQKNPSYLRLAAFRLLCCWAESGNEDGGETKLPVSDEYLRPIVEAAFTNIQIEESDPVLLRWWAYENKARERLLSLELLDDMDLQHPDFILLEAENQRESIRAISVELLANLSETNLEESFKILMPLIDEALSESQSAEEMRANWKRREAAVMCVGLFGSAEDSDEVNEQLGRLVPLLLRHLDDPCSLIRFSTIGALDNCSQFILDQDRLMTQLVQALCKSVWDTDIRVVHRIGTLISSWLSTAEEFEGQPQFSYYFFQLVSSFIDSVTHSAVPLALVQDVIDLAIEFRIADINPDFDEEAVNTLIMQPLMQLWPIAKHRLRAKFLNALSNLLVQHQTIAESYQDQWAACAIESLLIGIEQLETYKSAIKQYDASGKTVAMNCPEPDYEVMSAALGLYETILEFSTEDGASDLLPADERSLLTRLLALLPSCQFTIRHSIFSFVSSFTLFRWALESRQQIKSDPILMEIVFRYLPLAVEDQQPTFESMSVHALVLLFTWSPIGDENENEDEEEHDQDEVPDSQEGDENDGGSKSNAKPSAVGHSSITPALKHNFLVSLLRQLLQHRMIIDLNQPAYRWMIKQLNSAEFRRDSTVIEVIREQIQRDPTVFITSAAPLLAVAAFSKPDQDQSSTPLIHALNEALGPTYTNQLFACLHSGPATRQMIYRELFMRSEETAEECPGAEEAAEEDDDDEKAAPTQRKPRKIRGGGRNISRRPV